MFAYKEKEITQPVSYSSPINLIGNTPLVELTDLSIFSNFNKIRVFAKLEMFNFGRSVKDRPALWMIEKAERSGILDDSSVIVEPTSGNTGIALAWIGRLKGYRVIFVMPDSMSSERRAILRSYGAELVLSQGEGGMDGAIHKARELAARNPNYVMLDQFSNPANVKAHFQTTGPELWHQTKGEIDYFVAGIGSGGTIMGVSQYLRQQEAGIQIIGVEPAEETPIPGLKNMKISETPRIFQVGKVDQTITVTYDEAVAMTRRLSSEASLLVGPSSGAALTGVLKLLQQNKMSIQGSIVTIFPDGGMKYLSQGLF